MWLSADFMKVLAISAFILRFDKAKYMACGNVTLGHFRISSERIRFSKFSIEKERTALERQ